MKRIRNIILYPFFLIFLLLACVSCDDGSLITIPSTTKIDTGTKEEALAAVMQVYDISELTANEMVDFAYANGSTYQGIKDVSQAMLENVEYPFIVNSKSYVCLTIYNLIILNNLSIDSSYGSYEKEIRIIAEFIDKETEDAVVFFSIGYDLLSFGIDSFHSEVMELIISLANLNTNGFSNDEAYLIYESVVVDMAYQLPTESEQNAIKRFIEGLVDELNKASCFNEDGILYNFLVEMGLFETLTIEEIKILITDTLDSIFRLLNYFVKALRCITKDDFKDFVDNVEDSKKLQVNIKSFDPNNEIILKEFDDTYSYLLSSVYFAKMLSKGLSDSKTETELQELLNSQIDINIIKRFINASLGKFGYSIEKLHEELSTNQYYNSILKALNETEKSLGEMLFSFYELDLPATQIYACALAIYKDKVYDDKFNYKMMMVYVYGNIINIIKEKE